MPASSESGEIFSEAYQSWDLNQLYFDLAGAKGKGLTPVEKQYLRGLLCYQSPNEIATHLHVAPDTVRNYLSKGLYRYIEELLIQRESETIRVRDWSRVPPLLESLGYRQSTPEEETPSGSSEDDGRLSSSSLSSTPALPIREGVPDVPVFYGRTTELAALKSLVVDEQCRLVAVLGLGGIGKTTLVAQLANELTVNDLAVPKTETPNAAFDAVVWRSLRSSPPAERVVADLLQTLAPLRQGTPLTPDFESQVSQLIQVMGRHRCLLILEDMQLVLQSGELAGQYEPGYESYGDLVRRVAETSHQSCVILTSWEKPSDVSLYEGDTRPVRSLKIRGMGQDAAHLLQDKGLSHPELWDELIMCYRGNPLALNIIATTIQELFGGDVAEFLNQSTLFLGDFTYLLHQQFERLSLLEKNVMAWLATHGKPVTLVQLRQGIEADIALSDLMKVLESLGRRSLMDKVKQDGDILFTLQPMVMKYVRRNYSPSMPSPSAPNPSVPD